MKIHHKLLLFLLFSLCFIVFLGRPSNINLKQDLVESNSEDVVNNELSLLSYEKHNIIGFWELKEIDGVPFENLSINTLIFEYTSDGRLIFHSKQRGDNDFNRIVTPSAKYGTYTILTEDTLKQRLHMSNEDAIVQYMFEKNGSILRLKDKDDKVYVFKRLLIDHVDSSPHDSRKGPSDLIGKWERGFGKRVDIIEFTTDGKIIAYNNKNTIILDYEVINSEFIKANDGNKVHNISFYFTESPTNKEELVLMEGNTWVDGVWDRLE